jgi:hypothetical protein
MRTLRVCVLAVVLAAVVFAGCKPRGVVVRQYGPAPVYVPAPAPAYVLAPPPPAPVAAPAAAAQADIEVETRGPVHEAFAEPVVYAAQTPVVVPRAPPPPVPELPPADRPADPRIVWVPGYWAWDDDRADFLWVSGCWRLPPPGYGWVPGYWTQVVGGFQWVEGFWLAAPANEVVYLPPPPASMEGGPPGLAPADNLIWTPGYWAWNGFQYVWMGGQWAVAQADWVWMPAHYIVTPRGCIFVSGYWDYVLVRRGILFAPCYFGRGVYLRAGFYYSPSVAIDLDVLLINLFARPRYGHYYFGDYYDARYAALGIHPWFEFHQQHRWYDPIAAHEAWRRRHDDPMWERREEERFAHLRDDKAARPAHTFAAQQAEVARLPKAERHNAEIAQPLSQVVDHPPAQMRFEKIGDPERRALERQAQEVHKYKEARARWETPPAATLAARPAAQRAGAVAPAAPPAAIAPTVRRPETAAARTPVAPPPAVRQPAAPPGEIKGVEPPRAVLAPPAAKAPVRPVAPPPTFRRPEEIRQPLAPERVNIPRPPITGRPPEAREPLPPPRPEPPRAEPQRVEPPRAEPPRAVAPAPARVEQPEPARGREDGRR